MADYFASVEWLRGDQPFIDGRYSRRHTLRFDGGLEVPGSSSPHSVPIPHSDAAALDPEEALVGALSSCHMLWFLAIAAKQGFRADRYSDSAVGSIGINDQGREWISRVTLKPSVEFSGDSIPSREQIQTMHREAHELCAIAHSVRAVVRCEPVFAQQS